MKTNIFFLFLKPKPILIINQTSKIVFYNKGSVVIKLKKFKKTTEMINELLELDPNYARVYFLIACLYSFQNSTHKAIKEHRSALNLDKNLLNDAKTDPDLKNSRESNTFEGISKNFEL